MTTLIDIDILRKVYEQTLERYNRTCRRVTALAMGGRCITDYKHRYIHDYVTNCKLAVDYVRRDLENAIERQAMAASV